MFAHPISNTSPTDPSKSSSPRRERPVILVLQGHQRGADLHGFGKRLHHRRDTPSSCPTPSPSPMPGFSAARRS